MKKSALKVHQLAKELGVNSKEIVARCKAEEIPDIETHLSPVSVGLAQTIREWFAVGAPGAAEARAEAAADARAAETAAAPPTGDVEVKPAAKLAKPSGDGSEHQKATKKAAVKRSGGAADEATAKPETHTEPQVTAKADSDAAGRSDTRSDAALGSKPELKGEATPDFKPELKSDLKTDLKPEWKPDSKPELKTDLKSEPKPELKSEFKAEAKPELKPELKSDHRPDLRTDPRSSAAAADSKVGEVAAAHGSHAASSTSAAQPSAHAPAASSSTGQRQPATGPAGGNASSSGGAAPSGGAPARTILRPTGPTARGAGHAGGGSQGAAPSSPAHGAGPGSAGPAERRIGPSNPPPPPPSFAPTAPPTMNVPKRPDFVRPVGPKLEVPTKSALAGPRVVRIEQPDQLPTPRPRSAPGTSGPGMGGGMRSGTGGTRTGGASGRTDTRRRDDTGRSGRLARGGSAGDPWRPQDLAEREDRLSRAGGFFKSHTAQRGTGRGGPGGAGRGGDASSAGPVHITEPITIKELSAATGVKTADILKKLFLMGSPSTINGSVDREKAIELMMDFDIELVVEQSKSAAEIIEERFADREKIDERPRAPVVTILGHVDHGKTSLLDRIRNANVASGEAGGITQKTSAFTVPVRAGDRDRVVTFIDTPGHEAFTNMRARGAKVTDIAVLVVAADDGVMPQTAESIAHAKAAGVPIVVALNKIDKPEATDSNIQRILGQLAGHELNPTEWGGTVEVVKTSATKGTGIQELLEILDYQADLLGLTADCGGDARGTVLEAKMEEGRGPVASVIVQEGTLKKGDFIVVGRGFGRVRDLMNDRGQRIAEAGPSTPIAISGIDELPDAGDKFFVVSSIKAAEEAAEERRRLDRERELAAPKVTLDTFFASLEKGKRKELALVVKADSQGSVEALRAELSKIGTEEIQVVVKHCAVGGITENDVALAEATKAFIVGFNVTSSTKARTVAEAKHIEIRLYDVIYDLKDDVTKAASGLLAPELKLEVLGHADVRQAFKISKVGMIAGCYVTDGTIERNAQIRVTRGGIVIEKDRRLEQLKRFKDDAKEVRAGQECGMKIVGYDDIKVGDVLECYKTVQVARSL